MVSNPIIGITAAPVSDNQPYGQIERLRVSTGYVDAVLASGGVPIVLPPQDGNGSDLLDLVDGIVFSGGADIAPDLYGDADVHPETYEINSLRDRFELSLIRGAIDRDLPVLCICRGIQVLNVAFGGSLYQHIDDQVDGPLPHRQHQIGISGDSTSHRVELVPDGLAAQVYGADGIEVNSLHHQSVRQLAPPLRAEGLSPDGVIEAISLPEASFVLGLQWHPELLFRTRPEQLKPFAALVVAAAARRAVPVS